jgi:mRNA interferase MazF
MARFVSGQVVVLPFPFTDFSSAKVRPALVLAAVSRGDVVLCQITSQAVGHPDTVSIQPADFEADGGLRRVSFALPHRVVTANEVCIRRAVGKLKAEKLNQIRERVCAIIREDSDLV